MKVAVDEPEARVKQSGDSEGSTTDSGGVLVAATVGRLERLNHVNQTRACMQVNQIKKKCIKVLPHVWRAKF